MGAIFHMPTAGPFESDIHQGHSQLRQGVEGFGVVTDYLVIEMGWVILNIVSKFLGNSCVPLVYAQFWRCVLSKNSFKLPLYNFISRLHSH